MKVLHYGENGNQGESFDFDNQEEGYGKGVVHCFKSTILKLGSSKCNQIAGS